MDFTMPVWSKNKLFLTVVFLMTAHLSAMTHAADIRIRHVTHQIINNIYVINADIRYKLNPKPLEALKSGIPLIFYLELEFVRPRDFLWNKKIIGVRQNVQLEHHPLSDRFVVTNLATGDRFSFNSLEDALQKMGEIRNLPVVDKKALKGQGPLIGRLRTGLDIESLPPPMRLQAWLSPQWWLSTGWYEWEILP